MCGPESGVRSAQACLTRLVKQVETVDGAREGDVVSVSWEGGWVYVGQAKEWMFRDSPNPATFVHSCTETFGSRISWHAALETRDRDLLLSTDLTTTRRCKDGKMTENPLEWNVSLPSQLSHPMKQSPRD